MRSMKMATANPTDNGKAAAPLLDASATCERWMTTKLRTVTPSDPIIYARDLLKLWRINQLPVVSGGKLLGIVTDRDLRKTSQPVSARATRDRTTRLVKSVMSSPAITLGPHSTLLNAAEVMRKTRIGSVPIVRGESLLGILTRSDILEAFVAFAHGRHERRASPPKRSPRGKSAAV